MQNIHVRFAASANFADVNKQVTALQARFAELQRRAMAASTMPGGRVDADRLALQAKRLSDVRNQLMSVTNAQQRLAVQGMRVTSMTETFTTALNRQKLTIGQTIRNMSVLKNVYKEQLALQQMMVVAWKRDGLGNIVADTMTPRILADNVDNLTKRLAFMNTVLRANAHMMVTWGKNMQWAGRQLMVGFTVPFTIIAGMAGKMAYDVENEMIRVQKVYETTAQDAVGKEQELAQLRTDSYNMASNAANLYGASIKETLETEARLAATGVRGADLLRQTNDVIRLATLGEIEYGQALEASIALQNAFGLSSDELREKMNFMNTIHNQTSLSLDDITESIPRAATAMSGLGVSVEEMVVLLVSMREKGVDAAEGANALKSAATRLLRPTPNAQAIFREQFGVDILEIAQRNAGNLFDILKELAVVMEGAPTVESAQALAHLFGTFQFNRLNAALMGITDAITGAGDASSQTARAMEAMMLSPAEHAATADEELQRWQNSAAGKIKRAMEIFRVEMAQLGESFLPIIASIVEAGGKFVKFINNLPEGIKKTMMFVATLVAIAGPIAMIVGLMGNLLGNFLKFGTFLTSLALKFPIVNKHQQAAALLAKGSAIAFDEQTRATQTLVGELQMLEGQLASLNAAQSASTGASAAQAGAAGATAPTGMTTTAGGLIIPTGTMVGQSSAIKKNFAMSLKHVTGLAVGVSALSMMLGQSGKLASTLQTASIAALMIGPAIARGWQTARVQMLVSGLVSSVRGAATAIATRMGPAFAAVAASVKGIGAAIAGLAGPIAIAAAAIGLLIMKVRSELDKAREQQERITNSTEDWAEALGYVKLETGDIVNDQGEIEKSTKSLAKTMAESNEELAKMMQRARTEQEALNYAIREGVKVAQSGGTADQARQAVEAMLGMKFNDLEVAELMLQVKVDWTEAESVLEAQIDGFVGEFERIVNNRFEQGNWEGFARIFTGTDDLNQQARAAADGMGRGFYDQLRLLGDQEAAVAFEQFQDVVAAGQAGLYEKLAQQNSELFRESGLDNFNDLATAYRMLQENTAQAVETYGWPVIDFLKRHNTEIKLQIQAEEQVARSMLEAAGATDEVINSVMNLIDARKALNIVSTVDDAEIWHNKNLAQAQLDAARAGREFTEANELKVLNIARAKAGLEAATSVEQGFGAAVRSVSNDLDDQNNALDENADAASDWANMVVDATRSAFGGARDFALSTADRIMQAQHSAHLDGIRAAGQRRDDALDRAAEAAEARFDARREASEARYDRALKAFDAKWERMMDNHTAKWERRNNAAQKAHEKRVDAIDKQIETERKLEEQRQRIFQAEKNRIQRLSKMFSMNIDFNMALNSGDLDQAAKLMVDAQSQTEQWQLDDLGQVLGDASSKRIEALNKEKKAEQDLFKERQAILKKQEQAERKRLDKKKKHEQEMLRAERDRYNKALQEERKRHAKGLQVARKANQDRTASATRAAQQAFEAKKINLELELMAIRASTPRNKREYNEQVKQIEAVYDKYGVRLTGKGNGWTKTIGNGLTKNISASAAKLRNDIKWKRFAKQIAEDVTSGAFGMNVRDFKKWIETGQFPTKNSRPFNWNLPAQFVSAGGITRHSGGPVTPASGGGSSSRLDSRVGYSKSSSRMPSEVDMRAKIGEYVINDRAHRMYGTDFMDSLNNGRIPANIGGPDLGFSGLFSGFAAGVGKSALTRQIMDAGLTAQFMQTMVSAPLAGGVSGAPLAPLGPGGFIRPHSGRITSRFGMRRHPITGIYKLHDGTDIAAPIGTGIRAAQSGRVSRASYASGYGNWVIIDHAGGTRSGYAHLRNFNVRAGQSVSRGQQVGAVGMTGNTTGPHTHFMIGRGGRWINPGTVVPGLQGGGEIQFDNTIANLHKKETVLTAPLSSDLKEGIRGLDASGNVEYNINMEFTGPVNSELDVKKAVKKAILSIERDKGPRRRVGGN